MSIRVLGLDQGTTSTRVLELVDGQAPRMLHAVRHSQHHPESGWCEQDPRELLLNLRACLNEAGAGVDAIALANQGESGLAWDALTREPLSPVITWQDRRTASDMDGLRERGAEALTLARAGLPLDPYFSASKLAWILENIPEAKAAHQAGQLRLGTTDAFFLDSLTGVFATDVSTASRTSLMNLETGAWDPVLCEAFGVPIACLPEIRPSIGDFGSIDGVPVRAAVVDQQAALWGHGCRTPGAIKITFGTGAFALAVTGHTTVRAPDSGLLPTVAWAGPSGRVMAIEGGVYDAGTAVEWAQKIGVVRDVSELDAFEAGPAIARGLAFVPALSGLACPHWDRTAAGLWIGMSADTSREDMAQALLEGIAFRTAEVIDTIAANIPLETPISIDGGLSRSGYFRQFLADVLGWELSLPAFDELTALGCAQMARTTLPGGQTPFEASSTRLTPRPVAREAWRQRHRDGLERSRGWR